MEASNGSPPAARSNKTMERLLMALNCVLLGVGATGGQLLSRLYYNKGGDREWLQTGGWPLLVVPLAAS